MYVYVFVFQEVSQRLVNLSAQLHALQVCHDIVIHIYRNTCINSAQNELLRYMSNNNIALLGCSDTTGLHLGALSAGEPCVFSHHWSPSGSLPVPGW